MKFQLTISGDNFLFSRLVNFDQVKQISTLVMQQAATIDTSEITPDEETAAQTPQRLDFATFLQSKQTKRTPDKIVTLIYFLWKYRQLNQVERQDVVDAFEQAMQPVPKNISRDLRWAEKIGWIAEKSDSGIFYLTQLGKEIVERNFPSDLVKKTTIASTL